MSKGSGGRDINLPSFLDRVSSQEKINFARHLSVGIKSGMSLLDSLRLISQQAESRKFKSIINRLTDDINNGQSLAESLENYESIFGGFFISMVRVGEAGGNLSESLLFLSEELKKRREVSRKIRSALVYPGIILVATLGIAGFLVFFIFPKILPVLIGLSVELPLTTKFVIAILTFLQAQGLLFLGSLIVVIIAVRALLRVKKIHFYFDKFLLSVPIISKVIIDITLTNFTRSMGVLLKSGMTLVDSLEIARFTFHNKFYHQQISGIIRTVQKGGEMTKYLSSRPDLFPPMLVGMIKVGEGTGNLEQNLFYLSDYYEGELDEKIKTLTTTIEPILLLVMGLLVGFVALSIITPIYQVTQGIR